MPLGPGLIATATDTASTMMGKHNGVATRFQKKYQKNMINVPCTCRKFALADASKLDRRECVRVKKHMTKTMYFFKVRPSAWLKVGRLNKLGEGGSRTQALKRSSTTRWLFEASRVKAHMASRKGRVLYWKDRMLKSRIGGFKYSALNKVIVDRTRSHGCCPVTINHPRDHPRHVAVDV